MGCITVSAIRLNTSVSCKCESENGIDIQSTNMNAPLVLRHESSRPLELECYGKNISLKVSHKIKNIGVKINAALVCEVSYGNYEFFYVSQGALVVANGFLMVEKQQ